MLLRSTDVAMRMSRIINAYLLTRGKFVFLWKTEVVQRMSGIILTDLLSIR